MDGGRRVEEAGIARAAAPGPWLQTRRRIASSYVARLWFDLRVELSRGTTGLGVKLSCGTPVSVLLLPSAAEKRAQQRRRPTGEDEERRKEKDGGGGAREKGAKRGA